MVRGEMDVSRVKPYQAWVAPHCELPGLVRTPVASGGHPLPGDGSGSAFLPVDDVHQAWITEGVRAWRMILIENK